MQHASCSSWNLEAAITLFSCLLPSNKLKSSKKAKNKAFPVYFRLISGKFLRPDLVRKCSDGNIEPIKHIRPISNHFRFISGSFPVKNFCRIWPGMISVTSWSSWDIIHRFKSVSGHFRSNRKWPKVAPENFRGGPGGVFRHSKSISTCNIDFRGPWLWKA